MAELELKLLQEPRKRKKFDRTPYYELIKLTEYGLCNICKFAQWEGWSSCEADLECKHFLFKDDEEHPQDVWMGSDCYAFRPNMTLQQLGVFTGICLQGKTPAMDNGEVVMEVKEAEGKHERD